MWPLVGDKSAAEPAATGKPDPTTMLPAAPNKSLSPAQSKMTASRKPIPRELDATRSPPAPPVHTTIGGREYSCYLASSGVPGVVFRDETNDGTAYEANISKYLPLLPPRLTRKRRVAVRQPRVPPRLPNWWKAQCGFRGLSVEGTLAELQARLRAHGSGGMSETMKEACRRMETDYLLKTIDPIETTWERADNHVKARMWPKRLLHEAFSAQPGSREEVLVVEVNDGGKEIGAHARKMKMHFEMKRMPEHHPRQRLVVVGPDQQAVSSKFAEIEREILRSLFRKGKQRQQRQYNPHGDFAKQLTVAQAAGSQSQGEWDVAGVWRISCPGVEEYWGSCRGGGGCSLELRLTRPGATGEVQMYASFDFIIVTGTMRFVSLRTMTGASSGARDDSAGKSTNDDEGSDRNVNTAPEFLLPKASLPSLDSRSFNFRWRGKEFDEGEIQLYSDCELCPVSFDSPNALTGVFKSSLTGEVAFQGFKVGFETQTGRAQPVHASGPENEWNSMTEAAYQRERALRWA